MKKAVRKKAMQGFMKKWIGVIATIVAIIVAILGIFAAYHIFCLQKDLEKEKDDKSFKEEIKERVSKLETKIEMLITFYPQLKSLEKLENFERLKLTEDEIRKTVSEVMKTTKITPESITADNTEPSATKRPSEQDIEIVETMAKSLSKIDERFKKPVGNYSDYLSLGNVEDRKGNYLKAIEYYDRALELKPNYFEAWNNKGIALVNIHRYDEAIKAYEKAIELLPNNAYVYYNKACAHALKQDKENTLKSLSKALKFNPKLKDGARKNECFRDLWNDEDFKKL